MRRMETRPGVRMAMFLNVLRRWESAELNQEEAAELLGVSERTFRRWRERYDEEGEAGLVDRRVGKASGKAGSARPGAGGGGALTSALCGLPRQALPRASGEGSRLRLGVHLDESFSAVARLADEGAAQGRSPAQTRAAAAAGDNAASGRLAAEVNSFDEERPEPFEMSDDEPLAGQFAGLEAISQRTKRLLSDLAAGPAESRWSTIWIGMKWVSPSLPRCRGAAGTRWLDDGVVGRGSSGECLLGEAMEEQPACL